MTEVKLRHVRTDEQRRRAGKLIRLYLSWLLQQAREKYRSKFDVDAIVASDVSDDSN